jgi:hypothetical protein
MGALAGRGNGVLGAVKEEPTLPLRLTSGRCQGSVSAPYVSWGLGRGDDEKRTYLCDKQA